MGEDLVRHDGKLTGRRNSHGETSASIRQKTGHGVRACLRRSVRHRIGRDARQHSGRQTERNRTDSAGTRFVEVGTTRVIGGIRPQNYDVAYRPDGPRVVFDSKTLNDEGSIGKNWQNMINDLASEAATVHTRFPFCVVAFIVVLPMPVLREPQYRAIASTLERLGSRKSELDQHHLAEAIALVLWDPETGKIVSDSPASESSVHLYTFHERLSSAYIERYQHLPPHLPASGS